MANDLIRMEMQTDQVKAALNRLVSAMPAGGDMTPVMRSLGRVLLTGTQLRFRQGKDPDNQAWKTSMRAAMHGGQTLKDSGGLLGSIVYQASNGRVEIGTNKVYAAIHQFGGSIKPKGAGALAFRLPSGAFVKVKKVTMPKRPFLGVSPSDETELLDVLQTHYSRLWR